MEQSTSKEHVFEYLNSTDFTQVSFSAFQIIAAKISAILIITITIPMSTLGIIFNMAIMILIPKCKTIPINAKLYYVVICIFELFLLLEFHILTLIPWGIAKFTEEKILLPFFESMSPVTCSINRSLIRIWDGASLGITFAFAVERAMVIKFPFQARKLTVRKNLCFIFGIIFFYCLGGFITSRSQYLQKLEGFPYRFLCTYRSESYFVIMTLCFDSMIYIPNIMILIVTLNIMRMLKERIETRRKILMQKSLKISKPEIITIKILIVMAIIRAFQLIFFAPLNFIAAIESGTGGRLGSTMLAFFGIFTIFWDPILFSFYFYKIVEFRKKVLWICLR